MKIFLFQTIQFNINTQFKCKYNLIVKNISISSYSVSSNNSVLLHIVLLKCQIAFLKFTSCDNQALVCVCVCVCVCVPVGHEVNFVNEV